MVQPINLNRARKAKARVDAEAQSAANRAKFGRTKAQKQQAEADKVRLARVLDQARRDD